MASTVRAIALARLGQATVGPDAVLRIQAPEQARVAAGHGRIVRGRDEHPLPPEVRAQVLSVRVETIVVGGKPHRAPPPAAARTALLTATRASWTLYALPLSGFAALTAASPAAWALASLTVL